MVNLKYLTSLIIRVIYERAFCFFFFIEAKGDKYMKDLPVFIGFKGDFTDFTGEKFLEPKPINVSLRETLFYLKEYDYSKIIDLLRFAIVHSEESPQCLFRDYDDNDYVTYQIFCDWGKEGYGKEEKEFKKILKRLFEITELYVEDYLMNRLCNIDISYPKSWEDNKPEFWKKVYAE